MVLVYGGGPRWLIGVKYFVLGLLFLVVAGVIAYDKWNTEPFNTGLNTGNSAALTSNPPNIDPGPRAKPDPKPDPKPEPKVDPKPEPRPEPKPDPKPEPKPEPKPDPKPQPKVRIHVVKSGDTLGGIASKYYGTSKAVSKIIAANPSIGDKNLIRIGDKLKIPDGKFTPVAEKPIVVSKVPERYTVKRGDNLYKICKKYYGSSGVNARVAEVMRLNHLYSANLKPGAVLVSPAEMTAPRASSERSTYG